MGSEMCIRDSSKASDVICLGEVLQSKTLRNEEGALQTQIIIEVNDYIKGAPTEGSRLTVVTPGGRLGDEVSYAPHSPQFHPSELVLLFLKGSEGQTYEILNTYEGRFTVFPGPMSQEPVVIGFEPQGDALRPAIARNLDEVLEELKGE